MLCHVWQILVLSLLLALAAIPAQQTTSSSARSAVRDTVASCDTSPSSTVYAFRLHPGQDVYTEIVNFAANHSLSAAYIISCVGSLTQVILVTRCDMCEKARMRLTMLGRYLI